MPRTDLILKDFQYSLRMYHKALLEKTETRRNVKPSDYVKKDFTRKVIGKTEKTFVKVITTKPEILFQRADKFYGQWKEELENLEGIIENSLERVIEGVQEDIYYEIEQEYGDEDGDIDFERMGDERGITDPKDIDPNDIVNGEYDSRYDMDYFISYMYQELGHNVDGRYPFWDRYVRPFFRDSDMQKSYYTGIEDIISKPLNIIHNLQDDFEPTYQWLRSKLSMIVYDVKYNRRASIRDLFQGERFHWKASENAITN